MRVTQVNLARPNFAVEPGQLLDRWPTLSNVASAARKAGADVTVVQAFPHDARLERQGVRYHFVSEAPVARRLPFVWHSRVVAAVAETEPKIIHLQGLDFAGYTRALTSLGVPVLVQDHASYPGRLRRRWSLQGIAAVAFTACEQAEPFIKAGDFPADLPVYAVPESSTHFKPGPKNEARARTGMWGDPAVLWVGRLDANKDPLTVLGAIEAAAESLPGLQLWCCFHEAPLIEQVRMRIAGSFCLKQRVHLLGSRPHEEIETLARAADFFMLASHREGSGYALIEALACGATPIVSDIPSFRALTGNGAVGALVTPGDIEGFTTALVRHAGCDVAAMRRQTIAHFDAHLSFEMVGERLFEIYAELAEQIA